MIKDNQKVFNNLNVIMDAVITAVSYILAYFIKFYLFTADNSGVGILPLKDYFMLLLFLISCYMLLYYFCNFYGPKLNLKRLY